MSSFNKNEYDNNFKKDHYKQFKVDLPINEKEDLDNLLNFYNMTKSKFLRNAIINFKEEKKMKKYCVTCECTHFVKDNKGWRYDGLTVGSDNDCEELFDTIEGATEFYNKIKLDDKINLNGRYSESKYIWELDEKDIQNGEINLNDAKIIKDECIFTDYH